MGRFEPGLKAARHRCFVDYLDGKIIAPINVEISPSGKCNAACEACFYRQDPKKISGFENAFLKEERVSTLMKEFRDMGVRSISWTGGGEPTLHPSFGQFVLWAYDARIRQGLFTNALGRIGYDPSKFDWIRVSKTNHPWNFENLKYLRSCNTLGMCINYRGKEDDSVIDETLDLAEKVKATYVQLRPALRIAGEKTIIEVPKITHPLLQITEYKFTGVEEGRDYELCEGFHFIPFIWQDGDVDVCGYHKKDAKYNLGNIYSSSFEEIMKKAPAFVSVSENCQICCKLNAINSTIFKMRQLQDVDFP